MLERARRLRLELARSGEVVADPVAVAMDFLPRLVGLMGRRRLEPLDGLWLEPGGAVHTFAMGFSIDVVFLDEDARVVRVRPRVPPRRICLAPMGTRATLELPPGRAAGVGLAPGAGLAQRPS